MLDKLVEDLGYALEELERTATILEIAQLLADTDTMPDLALDDRKRYTALLTQQAVWANDTALDFFKLWPEHLVR